MIFCERIKAAEGAPLKEAGGAVSLKTPFPILWSLTGRKIPNGSNTFGLVSFSWQYFRGGRRKVKSAIFVFSPRRWWAALSLKKKIEFTRQLHLAFRESFFHWPCFNFFCYWQFLKVFFVICYFLMFFICYFLKFFFVICYFSKVFFVICYFLKVFCYLSEQRYVQICNKS